VADRRRTARVESRSRRTTITDAVIIRAPSQHNYSRASLRRLAAQAIAVFPVLLSSAASAHLIRDDMSAEELITAMGGLWNIEPDQRWDHRSSRLIDSWMHYAAGRPPDPHLRRRAAPAREVRPGHRVPVALPAESSRTVATNTRTSMVGHPLIRVVENTLAPTADRRPGAPRRFPLSTLTRRSSPHPDSPVLECMTDHGNT
jgi:hypothetical protein